MAFTISCGFSVFKAMEEGGTYLEDFLISLELLPNDVRRDFELVRRDT